MVIQSVEVISTDTDQLAVGVKFKARDIPGKAMGLSGKVYLSGMPVVDSAAKTVRIDGLDYDISTRNKLLDGAEYLLHTTLRDRLAEALSFSFADQYDQLVALVDREMTNRDIAKGVQATVVLTDLQGARFMNTRDRIRFEVRVKGNASVKVLPEVL